jgi:Ran-binding protein 1
LFSEPTVPSAHRHLSDEIGETLMQDALLSVRAKLFIHGETMLDKGTGKKSWVERGVGEIRLLKHREQGTIRVLMRQEKTMKVIANHQLDSRIVLTPNVSSDRSWVWVAYDFADGAALVETTFACRFKDSAIANDFKAEFEKYQLEMKKFCEGLDSADAAAGDEVAAALATLTTKDADATEETKPSEEKEDS